MPETSLSKKTEKQPLKVVQWSKPGPYGENSKNQVMKNAAVVIYKSKKRQEELSRGI